MKNLTLLVLGLLMSISGFAKLQTRSVEYKEGDTVLEGYLAYDDASKLNRPGIIVVHEWTGLGTYAKGRAEKLANLGYIAFAADIYGKGVRPHTPEEAGKTAGLYKSNRPLLRARVLAALTELKKQKNVDPKKIAAIGYCFGGTTVLELARSGADIAGTVSFHGGLMPPTPEDAKNIKGRVLALHGADDPHVNAEEVAGFEKEMRDAKVDWELIKYSGAVHSFTNPEAGNDNSKGAAYNEKADQRSWEAMKQFFSEIFKSQSH